MQHLKYIMYMICIGSIFTLLNSGCQQPSNGGENRVALEQQAKDYERMGKYEDAISTYRTLNRQYPDNAEYLYQLGKLLAWSDQWREARVMLDRSLRIDPNMVDARIQLAYIALWEKKYDQAESDFNQILDEYPGNTDAMKGLEKVQRERQKMMMEQ